MIHVGIDPGLHGALAVLDAVGTLICVADLPVISDRALKWIDGGELQSLLLAAIEGRPATVMIERVSAMPKQGIALSVPIRRGLRLGARRVASPAPADRVRDARRVEGVLCPQPGQARELAQGAAHVPSAELHLAKHEGRGEALLLAEYGRRTHTSRAVAGQAGAELGEAAT